MVLLKIELKFIEIWKDYTNDIACTWEWISCHGWQYFIFVLCSQMNECSENKGTSKSKVLHQFFCGVWELSLVESQSHLLSYRVYQRPKQRPSEPNTWRSLFTSSILHFKPPHPSHPLAPVPALSNRCEDDGLTLLLLSELHASWPSI